MAPETHCHSPYGVKATSVAEPLVLDRKADLMPFERVQVERLIAQLDASPARVRTAVLQHIRKNHRTYR